jgi:hypothetical protein
MGWLCFQLLSSVIVFEACDLCYAFVKSKVKKMDQIFHYANQVHMCQNQVVPIPTISVPHTKQDIAA